MKTEMLMTALKKLSYSQALFKIFDLRNGQNYLLLYGPQDFTQSQAIYQAVLGSDEPVAGTYVHIVQWPKGFITIDQGCTSDIKSRTQTRLSETRKEGGKECTCQTILTFSYGNDPFNPSYYLMEKRNMTEVLFDKTVLGYKKIPFQSRFGLIEVPIAGTLNLNYSGSPVPFPAKYRPALLKKTYEAWQEMQKHPELVEKVQKGEASYKEFLKMCES